MLVADRGCVVAEFVVDLVDDAAVLPDALGVPRWECEVAVTGAERAVVAPGPRPDLEGAAEGLPLALDAQPAEFGLRVDVHDGPIVARRTPAAMTLHCTTPTY